MRDTRHAVLIQWPDEAKTYSPQFQTEEHFRTKWHRVLEKAYDSAPISCLCYGRGEKQLAIRHSTRSGSFSLARYPLTGPNHSPDCLYYAPDAYSSGMGSYARDVVEELSNGDIRVRLRFGLQPGEPCTPPAVTVNPRNIQPQSSKSSMSLLALLHLLWSETNLHSWSPAMHGKRNLSLVHFLLRKLARKIQVGKHHLNDFLLVASPHAESRQSSYNSSRVTKAVLGNHRLVVIAPLAAHTNSREEADDFLSISGFHGIPRIRIDQAAWSIAKLRYEAAIRAWRKGSRVIAIVHTTPPVSESSSITMLSVGLMPVSEQWIPFDSQYEAVVEQKLRKEGRRFYKPLRFDASDEHVFPDFWLTDFPDRTEMPMEVFGMQTPEYLMRKYIKTQYYNDNYGVEGWWSWDAAESSGVDSIPAFPQPRSHHS